MSTPRQPDAPRTVQDYIDETPLWRDGTPSPATPMTGMQWRIWALASAGKFFEGLVVFMTGVALPLIVREFGLGPAEKGAVGAMPLVGILIGATALGGLADRFGRKTMFIVEMALFALCLALLVYSPTYEFLLAALFGVGLSLGCDYPTAHMVISESIPSAMRGRLVLGAFGFQAVGALVGTAVGYLILEDMGGLTAWRWMYATAVVPALLVMGARLFITDSAPWLASRGRMGEAEEAVRRLLRRDPPYPAEIALAPPPRASFRCGRGFRALFSRRHRRATILAAVPWFLQDLGTYGIGIFTPTILASVIGAKARYARNLADVIHNEMSAARGAAFIDLLLLVGIVAAVLLADRVGRIRLQVIGFVGCAAGLLLAALSLQTAGTERTVLLFCGFMLFSFMTNLGPNAMTYLLAGEVFPTAIRGLGSGVAASTAKAGAAATAFLFPILLADLGTGTILSILVGTSLLGAAVTWLFRIETTGVNLETLDAE
ncbi:MFS transporter [Pseudodesulfovibrio sp.]|uniref:MFS transporter n=1 Tax=Pseudodesulfovibrio sp. TaxID=2035812 RepID=UPI002633CE63|nr:MFS transporter [Pseudodesulfovibrio sp.]MDD3311535.1 MFS transporter [Pseudodesulfovibrio sp.]